MNLIYSRSSFLTNPPFRIALLVLLVLLPVMGGGNYFFEISPLWGHFLLVMSATVVLFLEILLSGKNREMMCLPAADLAFLSFIVLTTVSAFFSRNRPESVVVLLSFWGSIALIILARLSFQSISMIEWIAKGIVLSTIPVLLYEFYQAVWQMAAITNEVSRDPHLGHIRGHFQIFRTPFSTFMTSNNLASYLVMAVPLNLYFIIDRKSGNRIHWLALFCLISTGVFLTGSKGGAIVYFILLAAGLWHAWFAYKHDLKPVARSLAFAVFVSIIAASILWNYEWKPGAQAGTGTAMSIFANPGEKLESSASGRLEYWRTAMNMWKDHWIFGTGIGTFAALSPRYQESAFYSRHAHNDYLEMLAETGLAGLTTFLVFMFLTLKCGICLLRKLRAPGKAGERQAENGMASSAGLLTGFLILSLSGFLLRSLIDFDWEIMANRTMALLLASMITGVTGLAMRGGSVPGRVRIVPAGIVHSAVFGMSFILVIAQGIWLPRITIAESYFTLASDPFETDLSRRIEYAGYAEENFPSQYKYGLFLAAAYRQRSLITKSEKDLKRARIEAERALKSAPLNAEGHALLAGLLSAQGENKEAEAEWFRAIEQEKMNLSYYNQLGLFYIQSGNYEEARAILQKGLGLEEPYKLANHPDLAEVAMTNLYLGELYEALRQPEESLKKYQTAVRFYDQNPGLRTSGNWEILQSGIPSNIVSYAHERSAVVYYALGNVAEAAKESQLAKRSEQ